MTKGRKILVSVLVVVCIPAAMVGVAFLGLTPFVAGPLSPSSAGDLSSRSRNILLEADTLDLYSVSPRLYAEWGHLHNMEGPPFDTCLASLESGAGVLGKVTIADAAERRAIADGVMAGKTSGSAAACYDPRHVLVATKGKDKLIVLICFACSYVVFLDEANSHDWKYTFYRVDDLHSRLAAILRANNIEIDRRH